MTIWTWGRMGENRGKVWYKTQFARRFRPREKRRFTIKKRPVESKGGRLGWNRKRINGQGIREKRFVRERDQVRLRKSLRREWRDEYLNGGREHED